MAIKVLLFSDSVKELDYIDSLITDKELNVISKSFNCQMHLMRLVLFVQI